MHAPLRRPCARLLAGVAFEARLEGTYLMSTRDTRADSPRPEQSRTVLVIDVDAALTGLFAEWLAPDGIEVWIDDDAAPGTQYDLLIVDLAFPRQGGRQRVARVAQEHPDTPIIAISSGFLPGGGCCARIAYALGVAAVLPKPMLREQLQGIVHRLLRR